MTYSLTLRENTGTYSLTWAELDNNFLFLEGLIATSSVAIDANQVAFGTGTGLTSSPEFTFMDNLLLINITATSSYNPFLALGETPFGIGTASVMGLTDNEDGGITSVVGSIIDDAILGGTYSTPASVLVVFNGGGPTGVIVDSNGTHYRTPSTLFTFPNIDGSPGYVMSTDGSGNLYFTASSGGGSLPSGTAYQILYRNGSNIPGFANLLIDSTGFTSVDFWVRTTNDSTGVISIDYDNRRLYDSVQTLSLDWQNRILSDSSGATSSDYGNRVSFDLFNQTSLNWETRQLRDATSMLSLDWAFRQLSSTTAMVLDFENLFLQDSSATQSVDWNNRLLKGSNGVQTLDWNNKNMSSTDGQGSIQWDARHLIADSNLVSLDWNNRQLLDTTQLDSLDWQNRNLVDASGLTISVAWQQRRMFQANGNISMDWDQLNLNDSTGFESIGFGDRNLWSKSAGTYVLNWDSQHMLTSTGSLILDWAGPNIELGSIATGHKLSIDPQGEFTFTTLLPSSNTLTTNGGVSGPFSGEGFSVDYTDIPTGGQGVLNIGSNPATGTASVAIGYFNGGGQSNFIIFTDTNVQITSQNSQSLWPTTNGAPNEVMATDGSGNLFFKPITLPYVYSTQSDAFVYPIVNNTINVIDTTGSVVTSCSFDVPNAPNDGDVFELKILGAGLTGVSWFPSVSGANVIYPPTALPASNQVYKWVYDVNLNLFV